MTGLSALVLIAILVIIHEFGHFIVAKACGVQVDVFSVGFGRTVFSFKGKETEYRLGLLPFGGYVKMAGADPFTYGSDQDAVDPRRAFGRKPIWQRLLIIAAGPVFNLLLPIVTFTLLLMSGEPQPSSSIGEVEFGTPAHHAGLLAGDQILQINGVETPSWEIVLKRLDSLKPGKYDIVIDRDGDRKKLRIRIKPDTEGKAETFGISYLRQTTEIGVDDPRSPAGKAGLQTGDVLLRVNDVAVQDFAMAQRQLRKSSTEVPLLIQREGTEQTILLKQDPSWRQVGTMEFSGVDSRWGILPATVFIADVAETVTVDESGLLSSFGGNEEQSPAYLKGLRAGDRFSKIDGQSIRSWGDVLETVGSAMQGEGEQAKARLLKLELVRSGQLVTVEMLPKMIRDTSMTGEYRYRPILGTTRDGGYADGPVVEKKHSFDVALDRATKETVFIAGFIVKQIGKLITGEAAVSKNLGGPVEIVRQASEAAEDGLYTWVRLMSLLSISLGVVNLVPVPVLDGGQLVFLFLELIRGRPVSLRTRERFQQIGVLFLVLLMMFVLVFDINRWLGG